jgi:hypothetical protein
VAQNEVLLLIEKSLSQNRTALPFRIERIKRSDANTKVVEKLTGIGVIQIIRQTQLTVVKLWEHKSRTDCQQFSDRVDNP